MSSVNYQPSQGQPDSRPNSDPETTFQSSLSIELSAQDSAAFADALLHPSDPNERLRAAARRHAELIDYEQ